MSEQKLIEIQESEIIKQEESSHAMMNKLDVIVVGEKSQDGKRAFRSTVAGATGSGDSRKIVKLISTISSISKSPMLSDKEHHVVSTIYRGLCISGAVYETYKKASGMDELTTKNRSGQLLPNEREKFAAFLKTTAAITVSVVANFIQREFADQVNSSSIQIENVDALKFDNPTISTSTFLYELERNIQQFAPHPENIPAVVYSVASKALEKIDLMVGGLEYTDYFTSFTYRVEKDEFDIDGFSRSTKAKTSELIMTFKKPEEVIGNTIAKHQAQRIAKMMMCYDFDRKLNPFADLGGFIFTFFGDGNPGTGKTTLIQMMAGLLNDYCQNANFPFYYENFSVDKIDSYQGKSAQHAKQFIRNVTNPNVIGFGTIDDIDQIAGKRGDAKASEGQLGVTATLMESFAGANTKVLGNASIGMFSNHPDQVDDALRQRAGARFLIDGPQTLHDFIDLSALFAGKDHTIELGNVDLFSKQGIKQTVAQSYEKHNVPETEELKQIFANTVARFGEINTFEAIGNYLHNIKEVDDRFTGRAVANIYNSATARTMDFDMPDEWFEQPETFLLLPYEDKKNLIAELKSPLTAEILLQEINRYADSEFRYANKADDIEIDKMVRNLELQEKALSKAQANKG